MTIKSKKINKKETLDKLESRGHGHLSLYILTNPSAPVYPRKCVRSDSNTNRSQNSNRVKPMFSAAYNSLLYFVKFIYLYILQRAKKLFTLTKVRNAFCLNNTPTQIQTLHNKVFGPLVWQNIRKIFVITLKTQPPGWIFESKFPTQFDGVGCRMHFWPKFNKIKVHKTNKFKAFRQISTAT